MHLVRGRRHPTEFGVGGIGDSLMCMLIRLVAHDMQFAFIENFLQTEKKIVYACEIANPLAFADSWRWFEKK